MLLRISHPRIALPSFTKYRSMTTHITPKQPLVLILGATGTGKSNLAIQIAQSLLLKDSRVYNGRFAGAEVINADAMQLYRGLPIITNKVTAAEQQNIPHHLLDHIPLEEEPWTVQQYVKEADRVIEDIRGRGNLPIVVGGTSYYVYGLLFKNAMIEKSKGNDETINTKQVPGEFGKNAGRTWPILEASNEDIYAKLAEVDPEMAKRWHPNDRRKIQRSLEIYIRSGRKASEIYDEQKQQVDLTYTNSDGPHENESVDHNAVDSLRYDPVIFWLEAEDQVLKDRLNKRVDTMLETGLLSEAQQMNDYLHTLEDRKLSADKSKGIWVSIGFKEMEPWIKALQDREMSDKKLETLKSNCVEAVKAGTRQYAKRQNRFIRLRLANAMSKAMTSNKLFLLDCTDLEHWQDNVLKPAVSIVGSFVDGEQLPDPLEMSQLARNNLMNEVNDNLTERAARKCETCNKILMTEKEWINHLESRSHKKILQGIRKRELNETRRAAQSTNSVDTG